MKCKKKTKSIIVAAALLVLGIGVIYGYRFAEKLVAWRHLDHTYSEDFASPAEIAPNLKGKKLVFHIRTGLDQDDSQICLGFNVVFAALEARSDVTVLFDAGALLDLTAKRHNLEATGVPLRLQKVIAAQMNLPLEEMPSNYKEYLELLHLRGASFHANTAMLIVTGDHEKLRRRFPVTILWNRSLTLAWPICSPMQIRSSRIEMRKTTMHRLATLCCLLTFAVGGGTSDPQPNGTQETAIC